MFTIDTILQLSIYLDYISLYNIFVNQNHVKITLLYTIMYSNMFHILKFHYYLLLLNTGINNTLTDK